jgi:hypothetical protein
MWYEWRDFAVLLVVRLTGARVSTVHRWLIRVWPGSGGQ